MVRGNAKASVTEKELAERSVHFGNCMRPAKVVLRRNRLRDELCELFSIGREHGVTAD